MTFEYREVLLQAANLNLSFGDNQVLRDLNLTIRNLHRPGLSQGQCLSIIGKSGTGKSCLLRILAGLQTPNSGTVRIRVGEQEVPTRAGLVGVVQQQYPLFRNRTVIGNLLVAGAAAGLDSKAANEKAGRFLDYFGLGSKRFSYPDQLSGGQRQRIAIAQQLMGERRFIILDEPFSGLDVISKDAACKLITDLASQDELLTIIVITHDIEAAVEISDTLLLMGRDQNPDGTPVPGSRIQKTINLAEMGLAWREGISETAEFRKIVQELKEGFRSL